MTELNEQHEIFKLHLKEFSTVLSRYGYAFSSERYSEKGALPIESMYYSYIQKGSDLEITFSFVIANVQDRTISLGVTMHTPDRKFFSLNEFFETNKYLKAIQRQFSDQGDFKAEAKTFFIELEQAFETYLNDQITGKRFYDHGDKLTEAYYRSGAPYEMQTQVVNNAKLSLWARLQRLFK